MLPFTIQIPVYNETQALVFSSFYFERMGFKPRYVLDAQRTPETEELLIELGHELTYFQNDKPFIENGYFNFSQSAPTEWILRLDCDEVPSRGLIEFCKEFVEHGGSGIVGFDRHQLIWKEGAFFTATTARFVPSTQRQWRLFNREHVTFDRNIHTPGIIVNDPVVAPPEAEIYHLSWIFLSWEDRVKKASRYDGHGQAAFNRENQLFVLEDAAFRRLEAPFLTKTFGDYSERPARNIGVSAGVDGVARAVSDSVYSRRFYEGQSAGSLTSAHVVLSELHKTIPFKSAVDVGCGVAPWLKVAIELGAERALGMDGDYVERDGLLVDPSLFQPCDLETGSLTAAVGDTGPFDLAICMEVAEHLSSHRATSFVAELCALSDLVLFSAAIPGQGGTNHINEQWPSYWSRLFHANSFDCFDALRPRLWEREECEWWYLQNVLLFAKRDTAAWTLVSTLGASQTAPPASLVHPRSPARGLHR